MYSSLQLQLALSCAGLGVITSVESQHSYSLTPFSYIANDYVTYVSL
jgi:photosystem I P700 chlorophyll a apoprotein A2